MTLYAGGDVLVELSGSKSTDFSGVSASAGSDATGWVPSGLRSVNLGTGGTVTLDFGGEIFAPGNYFAQVYYENSGEANVPTLTVNGNPLGTIDGSGFEVSENETISLTTHHFILSSDGTISLALTGANARIDYLILYSQEGGQIVAVDTEEGVKEFKLSQNYPNPFNPSTTINFTLPAASDVQLTVFNLLGQRVATLIDGSRTAGEYSVRFDARNLASGVYFYMLQAGDFTLQRKMTLIK